MAFWDPVDWVTSAYDWTAHQVDHAEHWVTSSIGKLAGWSVGEIEKVGYDVANFVDKGLHAITHEFFVIVDGIHHEIVVINRDIATVGQWAVSAAHWIESAERRIVAIVGVAERATFHDIIQPIERGLTVLIDDAEHVALSAVSEVRHELTSLERLTVGRLIAGVEKVPHEIESGVSNGIHLFERDVVGPIAHDVDLMTQDVTKLTGYVFHDVERAVTLVFEAADWLYLLAKYSISDLEGLAKLFTGDVTFADLEGAMSKTLPEADSFESWLERLFV